MRILGAAPANDNVVLVVIDVVDDEWQLVETSACRKIPLGDHEDASCLRAFKEAVEAFINSYDIDRVLIRRCTYKGQKRSGAASIKMEVLLQLIERPSDLAPAQSISKNWTSLAIDLPGDLNKYQTDALATALYARCK